MCSDAEISKNLFCFIFDCCPHMLAPNTSRPAKLNDIDFLK